MCKWCGKICVAMQESFPGGVCEDVYEVVKVRCSHGEFVNPACITGCCPGISGLYTSVGAGKDV